MVCDQNEKCGKDITPEMVEAGVRVFWPYADPPEFLRAQVRQCYFEMSRAKLIGDGPEKGIDGS